MAGTLVGELTLEDLLQRLVADRTPDLQTVTDAHGLYWFVSPAGLEPFGWLPADLFGRAQLDFIHPDDALLVEEAHRAALRGRATVTTTYRFR